MSALSRANSRQNQKRDKRYKPYKERDMRNVNKALKLMRHIRNIERRIQLGKQENVDAVAVKTLSALPELAKKAAKSIYGKALAA